MAEEKDYVDEAMDQMMDALAEAAETERLRQIAIQSGICMYCGAGAEGGACGDYKCWI
tara:strand:+ start:4351 stop:4524 length:174 start_codon:yes stop_codon:yes gene_type:complete